MALWPLLDVVRQGKVDGRFGRSRVLATMIDPRATVADTLATARSLATMKPTRKNSHEAMTETSTFCFFELMISFFARTTRARARSTTRTRAARTITRAHAERVHSGARTITAIGVVICLI